ncbi:MAG TPA: hypothetical protein PKY28_03875 [Ferruginibacter sp.]|nr:hypothetical protein [Ferruginibacter sp.]
MKKRIALPACCIIVCCILLVSCSKKEKQVVKEFYPSGKLKKSGWVNKDKVLIDTTLYYFENGNYQRIEVRDDSGLLNGISRSYHENGSISQETPYINNSIEGFVYSYTENGRLSSKMFRVKARPIGDAYWYDESGKIYQYDFSGFGNGHRNYIKYDKTGKIVDKIAPFLFIDSVSSYTPGTSGQKIYQVFLLLSNAPKCRTSVLINYLSKDSIIIKQDSLTGRSYFSSEEKFSQEISNIVFYGRQYDSLTGKNLSQKITRRLNDFE